MFICSPLAKLQSLAGQEIAVMRSNGRLVACGGIGGDIVLKDFRTMKTEHTIDAHQGISISLLYVLQSKDVVLEIFLGNGQFMGLSAQVFWPVQLILSNRPSGVLFAFSRESLFIGFEGRFACFLWTYDANGASVL